MIGAKTGESLPVVVVGSNCTRRPKTDAQVEDLMEKVVQWTAQIT